MYNVMVKYCRLCVLVAILSTMSDKFASGATLTTEASQDSWVYNIQPDLNFSTSGILQVANANSGSYLMHTFLQFDISGIPTGKQIDSAIMTLTLSFANNDAGLVVAQGVTAPWSESEVTWDEASEVNPWTTPGGDSLNTAFSSMHTPGQLTVTWNITDLVQDWYDGAQNNHGIVLKLSSGQALSNVAFRSSSYRPLSTTHPDRPRLDVAYSDLASNNPDPSVVPEPSTLTIAGLGCLAMLGAWRTRGSRRKLAA